MGKTSLTKRYLLNGLLDKSKIIDYLFYNKEQMTIGLNCHERKEYLGPNEDIEIVLDMWDTAG